MSDSSFKVELEAWWYNSTEEDKTLPHKHSPNRPVSLEHLKDLGVSCWKIDADNWQHDSELEMIKINRGYISWETITVAPGLLDNYEEKLQHFFHEHLHPYDESRLILDGSGYWDIRDYSGSWIRFSVQKGDMITLPPGMYHRFTLDTNNYIKALLLFTEIPSRIDVLKPDGDNLKVRKEYMETVLEKCPSTRARDHLLEPEIIWKMY